MFDGILTCTSCVGKDSVIKELNAKLKADAQRPCLHCEKKETSMLDLKLRLEAETVRHNEEAKTLTLVIDDHRARIDTLENEKELHNQSIPPEDLTIALRARIETLEGDLATQDSVIINMREELKATTESTADKLKVREDEIILLLAKLNDMRVIADTNSEGMIQAVAKLKELQTERDNTILNMREELNMAAISHVVFESTVDKLKAREEEVLALHKEVSDLRAIDEVRSKDMLHTMALLERREAMVLALHKDINDLRTSLSTTPSENDALTIRHLEKELEESRRISSDTSSIDVHTTVALNKYIDDISMLTARVRRLCHSDDEDEIV